MHIFRSSGPNNIFWCTWHSCVRGLITQLQSFLKFVKCITEHFSMPYHSFLEWHRRNFITVCGKILTSGSGCWSSSQLLWGVDVEREGSSDFSLLGGCFHQILTHIRWQAVGNLQSELLLALLLELEARGALINWLAILQPRHFERFLVKLDGEAGCLALHHCLRLREFLECQWFLILTWNCGEDTVNYFLMLYKEVHPYILLPVL